MKVVGRILAKLIILAIVIGLCAGGAAVWRGYHQATPEYTINRYLTYLTDGNTDRSFAFLDETGVLRLSREAFDQVTEAQKYELYSGIVLNPESVNTAETETEAESEPETGTAAAQNAQTGADDVTPKTEADGSVVYTVAYTDASGAVRHTDDITVRKMADKKYGLFDNWKIDPEHTMVHDLSITVPAGSTLTVQSEEADGQWLTQDEDPAKDIYVIPVIMPETVQVTVRHPVLDSVNTSLDPTAGPVDFTDRMPMKDDAKDSAKELGVAVVKNLLTAAVKEDDTMLNIYLDACKEEAEQFIEEESAYLHEEGKNFLSIAASSFAEQFGDMSFNENGEVELPMSFSYRYTIRTDVETESWLYFNDDGTPQTVTETQTQTGVSTAEMTLTWKEDGWTLTRLDIPITKE